MHKSPKQKEKLHQRNRKILCSFRDHVPPSRGCGGSLPAVVGQAPAAPRVSTEEKLLSWASSGGQTCRRKQHRYHSGTWSEKRPEMPSVVFHHPRHWELQKTRREVKLVAVCWLDMPWVNCSPCNCLKENKKLGYFYFFSVKKKEVMKSVVWTRN